MRSRRSGWKLATTLFGVMALGAGACADPPSTIFIRGVIAPPKPDNGQCLYTADSTQALQFAGKLDVGLSRTYAPVLLVGNQMASVGSTTDLRTETSRVILQGATVKVANADGTLRREFTVLGTGFADPSQGSVPGYALFSGTLLDEDSGKELESELSGLTGVERFRTTRRLVVTVRVLGKTVGGLEVETDDFVFPIDVCYGCLVSFPAEALSPTGDCNVPLTSNSGDTAVACKMGQDQVSDCRLCSSFPACASLP